MEKEVHKAGYSHVLWKNASDMARQSPEDRVHAVEQRTPSAGRSPEATPITPAVGYWTDGEPPLSTANNVTPPPTHTPTPENTSALPLEGPRPTKSQHHQNAHNENPPITPAEHASLPPYDATLLTRQLPRESGGNYKDYYHEQGEPVGFIGVKRGCSPLVLDRELAAKRAILTSRPSLTPYFGSSVRARHTLYGEGLLVTHLPFRIGPQGAAAEFKPKLLASTFAGAEKCTKIFNIITHAQLPLPTVRNELQHIAENLDVISAAVGELTLVITPGLEGSFVKMLDLAPNDKNQRMDVDSSVQASKGLSVLITALNKEISARQKADEAVANKKASR